MTRLLRGLDRLAWWLSLVAGAALLLMLAHAVVDIWSKYFLGAPIPATLEITAFYYMVAAVFLPLLHLELTDQQVSAEIGYNAAGPGIRRALRVFSRTCVLFFFGLLAYRTGWDALRSLSIDEISMGSHPVPLWPSKMLLPLGFGLAAFGALCRLPSDLSEHSQNG
jgi:TRAP-type C4-dicarboxylate transport system permease small subunit